MCPGIVHSLPLGLKLQRNPMSGTETTAGTHVTFCVEQGHRTDFKFTLPSVTGTAILWWLYNHTGSAHTSQGPVRTGGWGKRLLCSCVALGKSTGLSEPLFPPGSKEEAADVQDPFLICDFCRKKEALDIRWETSSDEDVWRSKLHRPPSVKGQLLLHGLLCRTFWV